MASEQKKTEELHSGMSLFLHPLVVISISDQFTRARLNSPANSNINLIGILLGIPKNGKVEITNCFDIVAKFDATSGKLLSIDEDFMRKRMQAFKEVSSQDTTVVGWYQCGGFMNENALIMARALALTDDTVLAMSFDGLAAYDHETKDIPIQLFEAAFKGKTPAEQTVSIKKTSYHVITIEAERIGVDHIAKTSTSEGSSQLTVHVVGMQGAMKMLYSKIDIICDYLKRVQNGGGDLFDDEIMRKIGVVYDLLLTAHDPSFDQRFFVEYNDEMLLTYLSSLTEGLQTMNTMADTHATHRVPLKRMRPKNSERERMMHF